jgi:hypothetical protein
MFGSKSTNQTPALNRRLWKLVTMFVAGELRKTPPLGAVAIEL